MGLKDLKVTEFSEHLASKEPVPGGGGASALVGAIAIALGDMVGELTVGKKKYANVEDQIKALMAEAQELRKTFLMLIDGDAECFAPLAKAYSIPKDDPNRDSIMEEALRTGCSVPMDIMRSCAKAIEVIEGFATMGSKLAISDAGCGALCAKAALQGASLNVFINTKSMKDRAYADRLETEALDLLAAYCKRADAVYESVVERIR